MRDQKLETLRGLALIFVLAHHAESGSWLGQYVSATVVLVMMPLFAAISGCIMGKRAIEAGRFPDFARGKLIRLCLPMVCSISLMLVVLYSAPRAFLQLYPCGPPESAVSFIRFFLVHPQTFWFLQALLVIFLIVGFVDSRGVFFSYHIWLLALAVSSLFLLTPIEVTGWLSLDGVQFLFPYFLLGLGFSRFHLFDHGKRYRWPIMIAALLFMLLVQVEFFCGYGIAFSQGSVLGVLGSLLLTSALLIWGGTIAWLARLGGCSYGIYLFHRLGWGLGILIIPFSPEMFGADLVLHVMLMLVVGYLVTLLFQRTSVTRTLFLGEKSAPARAKSISA